VRFQRLTLLGFGRFQGATFDLAPGFNLLYGPNEAGKSTLQAFLLGMLYGFKKPGQRRDYTPDLERYRPWSGGEYRGVLEYELERTGQQIRVERVFEPSWEQVRIYDRVTGADLTAGFPMDRRKERLFAQEHLGLTAEMFRSTAWVGQMQVSRLEAGRELVARIANLQQSGREDLSVRSALDWLKAKAREIGTDRAVTRPYGRTLRQLAALREEMQRAREAREQTLEWEARLTETRGALAEIAGELSELQRRLRWARHREAAERLARAEELRRRWAERAESLRREQATLEKDLADVEAELAPLQSLAERGEEILAELDRLEGQLARLGTGEDPQAGKPDDGVGAFRLLQVAAGLLAAAGVAVWLLARSVLAGGVLILAASGLFAYAVAAARRRDREARERQRRREAAEQERQRLQAERDRLLAEAGAGSAAEIRQRLLRHGQLAARRDGLKARVEQIRMELAEQPGAAGDAELETLRREVAALATHLEGEDPRDERSAAQLEEAVRQLEARQADLTARASDLAARVETVLSGAPDIADLHRQLAELEEEREAYEEELAVIELALEGIEAAAAEIHREFAPQLNEALSETAARLTRGRYRQVRLDEQMTLRVLTEDDRIMEASALSAGTVDQLYFSLRLALLDLLTEGQEPVPLMLDDPFVQYDDQRVQAAMQLLTSVARERQVLLFTSHRRELELGRALGAHVIELDTVEAGVN